MRVTRELLHATGLGRQEGQPVEVSCSTTASLSLASALFCAFALLPENRPLLEGVSVSWTCGTTHSQDLMSAASQPPAAGRLLLEADGRTGSHPRLHFWAATQPLVLVVAPCYRQPAVTGLSCCQKHSERYPARPAVALVRPGSRSAGMRCEHWSCPPHLLGLHPQNPAQQQRSIMPQASYLSGPGQHHGSRTISGHGQNANSGYI